MQHESDGREERDSLAAETEPAADAGRRGFATFLVVLAAVALSVAMILGSIANGFSGEGDADASTEVVVVTIIALVVLWRVWHGLIPSWLFFGAIAATAAAGFQLARSPEVDDFASPGFTDQAIQGVVAHHAGLVAVGFDESGGDAEAAVWVSQDGLTWAQVPQDTAALGGRDDQQMSGVTTFGGDLVAVGGDRSDGDWDAAVWTSSDAITWNRLDHDESIFGGSGRQGMQGVVAVGTGLVAVGFDDSGGNLDAAVWISPDGLSWSRVDEPSFGGVPNQAMNGVVVAPFGVVAFGTEELMGPVIWTSTDGAVWQRLEHDASTFGEHGRHRMLAMAATGSGLVAVGYETLGGGEQDAIAWVSTDGTSWSRTGRDTDLGGDSWEEMTKVIVVGTNLIAIGSELATAGSVPVVWSSPDGLTWTRVIQVSGFEHWGNGEVRATIAGDFGVLALGYYATSYQDWDAGVWTSPDGSTWTRVPPAGAVFGNG